MNLSIIVLRVITDGSRVLIAYFLLHLLVAMGLSGKKGNIKSKVINKKYIKRIVIISSMLIIGIIALYKTTVSRSGENLYRYFYYYFSMQPTLFETWANIVDNFAVKGYGLASTNGLWFAIFYVAKNILGLRNYPDYWYSIYNLILSTDTQWQVIAGDATIANAYVSLFWFLYLDGRMFGVIIGMIMYGGMTAYLFNMALKKRTPNAICLYSIILQGLCFSFIRLQFADIYYTIAVIFILLFAYKPVRQCLEN